MDLLDTLPLPLVAVGGLLVLGIAAAVLFRLASVLSGGGGAAGVVASTLGRVPRTNVLLVGLVGAGKTTLFSRLCSTRPEAFKTQTSMEPNVARALEGGATIVDFPGHQRLRHKLFDQLLAAKRLVVVIDSVTVHDDKTEGAKELSGLLLEVLQSHAFDGVKSVLFACTKRDEATSYSAKAVKRILEAEMARVITANAGAIGAIRGEVSKSVRKGGGGLAVTSPASPKDECLLYLEENGKFTFASLGVPATFIDCSSTQVDDLVRFCAE